MKRRRILVVGGTGPTGPHIVQGLLDRGHDVVILHRGVHEPDDLPDVRHIHADPHFAEALEPALRGERFDTILALYGRLERLATFFAGRCERFLAVGGRPVYAGYLDPGSVVPRGMRVLAREDSPLADPAAITDVGVAKFAARMRAAEDSVMRGHREGAYAATLFRYPYIYGARALGSVEWSVWKRIHDGRARINLPAGGLILNARCAAQNAAHMLLLALENEAAHGEIFNCADDEQYSLAQWVELIALQLGKTLAIVDVPAALRWTVTNFLFFAGSATDIAIADTAKAKRLLGYADVIAPRAALAEALRWYGVHPVEWEADPAYPDKFDYELEDRVADALQELRDRFAPEDPKLKAAHNYAHPKKPSLSGDEKGR